MRSSLSGNVVLVALAATSAAAFYGCSSSGGGTSSGGNPFGAAGAAGTPAVSSAGAPGISGGTGQSGSVGTAAGAGGAPAVAGAGGAPAVAGAGGAATAGGAAGAGGGSAGAAPVGDITAVVKTPGCGMVPPAAFKLGQTSASQTIMTSGTKPANCADSKCGAWMYTREYFVTLPAGYDPTKAYPLVFEGPGCGGHGTDVYPLTGPDAGSAQNVNNTVIRVGLTPPPNDIGHATNPNQGCFDDKEGDSSVDWVFYENLYDKLAGQLCFDKNRVFATGNSSGAWFSNEVGCKYAGDPVRPIRAIMPNTGGLPTDPKFVPTCTSKPMAGMWVGETNDPDNPFAGNVVGINRAIAVNKCTGGDWPASPTVDYPVTNNNMVCKQLTGCPPLYPLVVCLINGNSHASHDNITNPGFSKFIKFFSTPPQIAQ